jgi:PilZ domain-containing protein
VNFPQQQDRRRWRRFAFGAPVRIVAGSAVIDGRSIRMSEGGISVFALAHFPIGSRVTIQMSLPGPGQRISVDGIIRSRAVYLYGVEFLHEDGLEQEKSGLLRDAMISAEASHPHAF